MLARIVSATAILTLFAAGSAFILGAEPAPVIEITAEELGKAFAPDTADAGRTFQGREIRVNGRVTMAHEPFVYLATGWKFPTGQPVMVTFEDKAKALIDLAVGDRVIVEGKFDRKGIFGPILAAPKLVKRESTAKPTPDPKGEAPTADTPPATPIDPRAIVLRFDSLVHRGEPGYRPTSTSFRLRFGPGAPWRGTVIGESIAWGDGNGNKDHWGQGSGEPTFSGEVQEDAKGAYFIFTLNGTDWESRRVVALFRLTLPDGRSGLATAIITAGKRL